MTGSMRSPNLVALSKHNMQTVPDVSLTMVDGMHGYQMMPTPYSAYGLGRNYTHLDANFHALPSSPHSLHDLPPHYQPRSNDQNISKPFTPHHDFLHQSFAPASPHWMTHPDSQSCSPIHPPTRQDSTGPARRRRPACAVEYKDIWIDEAELLQGLAAPDGNINVHPCRWDEDRSPCHLRVKGDKSCINVHIQKWHGGKPGGDKLKADCRWSGCGTTMLKESIARHVVSIHLGEMWGCKGCGKEIARNDAYGRHAMRSDLEVCRTSGALITYAADARVVNARVALDGRGKQRYAGV